MSRPFNTPLEAGFRTLFVLEAIGRKALDSHRLVIYDYLLVHSGDVGGPPSLHAPAPAQTGELLVRRRLVQRGLDLMRSRELIERRYSSTGIRYAITKAGRHVAQHFDSTYAEQLRASSSWVASEWSRATDLQLQSALRAHTAEWRDGLIELYDFEPVEEWS